MNAYSHSRRRGFSLIEVLIALVVLATGMLAIAALQSALTRSSALTKSRGIAISVATGELERIRAESIRDKDFYDDLASAGAVALGTDDLAVGETWGDNFTVRRTVTRMQRFRTAADCGAQPVPCYKEIAAGDSTPTIPELKRVTVAVGWTDALGQAQSVSLTDIVPSVFNAGSLSNIDNPFGSAAVDGPLVKIQVPDDPGVIPIAVADGSEESAASNPKPIIYDRGSTDQTRFEILTYAPEGDTGTAALNRRIDVAVVGCRCSTEDLDPGGEKDFFDLVRTPTHWDGYRYVTPEINDGVVKRGYSASEGEKGKDVSQDPELCQTCCSDHHDYAENDYKYDSFRAADAEGAKDFDNGAHNHYQVSLDNSGTVNWTLLGDETGNQYNEVCRMIRVDGFWTVATDPLLLQMSLLETDIGASRSAKTAIPKSGTELSPGPVQRYQAFLKDVLGDKFLSSGAVRTSLNAHDPLAAGNSIESSYSDVLIDPSTLELGVEDDFWYLHNRGIFVDYLEDDAIEVLKQVLTDCKAKTPSRDAFDCILPNLPIVSINTTDIAQWDAQNQSHISVSNLARNSTSSSVTFDGEECAKNDKDCTTPGNRGLVDGKSEGEELAVVAMFRSSSAIADVYPIDPHDGAATRDGVYDFAEERRTDQQHFTVGSGGGGTGGDGQLVLPRDGRDATKVVDTGDSPRGDNATLSFTLSYVAPLPKPTPDFADLSFVLVSPVDGTRYTITPAPALSGTDPTGVSVVVSGISEADRSSEGWVLEVTNNGGKEVTIALANLVLAFTQSSTDFQVVVSSSASGFGFAGMGAVVSGGVNCTGITTTASSRTFKCSLDTGAATTGLTLSLSGFSSVTTQTGTRPADCKGKAPDANVCHNYQASSPIADAIGGTNGRLNEIATFNLPDVAGPGYVFNVTFDSEGSPQPRPVVDVDPTTGCSIYICSCNGDTGSNPDVTNGCSTF